MVRTSKTRKQFYKREGPSREVFVLGTIHCYIPKMQIKLYGLGFSVKAELRLKNKVVLFSAATQSVQNQ